MDNKEILLFLLVDGCGINIKKIISKNVILILEERNGKFKVIKIFLKNGKKSEKIFEGDLDDVVVEFMMMIYLRFFKVKYNLLVGKIIRKIDFD